MWEKNTHDWDAGCAVCAYKGSTTYEAWGTTECPEGHEVLYAGNVMGGHYGHRKFNFVCVDPERQEHPDSHRGNQDGALWYLAEYECGSLPCPPFNTNKEVACAVCCIPGGGAGGLEMACSGYISKSTCPRGQCIWGGHTCRTSCIEYRSNTSCPADCLWDDDQRWCTEPCADFSTEEDCPVSRCWWRGSECASLSISIGSWQLAMNIHPSDGHNFGYGAPEWYQGSDLGGADSAYSADYLSASAWSDPVGFVAIVRHQNGKCEAVKAWELTEKTNSLVDYFKNHNPGRLSVTGSEPFQEYYTPGMAGAAEDPLTGREGGGLVFNWWYKNNGCRIATTKAHHSGTLSAASTDDDATHGLGNELVANTAAGEGSSAWWHDVANMQGSETGGSVKIQGTDHGSSLSDGTMLGQYAIFVSAVETQFPCQGGFQLPRPRV